MTILFPNLQIARSDIRPHVMWAVSLMTAYGHSNLPRDLTGIELKGENSWRYSNVTGFWPFSTLKFRLKTITIHLKSNSRRKSYSFVLLMAHGLSKDIWYHAWPFSILHLLITKSHINPEVKWVVSLVIGDDHFNIPQSTKHESNCSDSVRSI